MSRFGMALLLAVLAAGCGGASGRRVSGAAPATESRAGGGELAFGGASAADERDLERGEVRRELREPARLAQATTPATTASSTGVPPQQSASPHATATDAVDTSGPLLIYTAMFHLAVYEVRESQERIVAATRELGGFVFSQSDDRLVVRVPAPRFHTALEEVQRAGDVEHREVQAQDVSEEFHDVEIRIRNLEAMRARVEALLQQARTVDEALHIEQQLARITEELELMRGRQRFLADRIAFSTITVIFRPRPRESLDQPEVFELPFGWLDELGLSNLLDLRS